MFGQVLLHILVDLDLLCVVVALDGLREQLVIFRVVIVHEVVVCVGSESLQKASGCQGICRKADHRRLEIPAAISLLEPCVPLYLVERRVDADFLELLSDDFRSVAVRLVVGRDRNDQIKSVGIARLCKKLFGFCRIRCVVIGQALVKILRKCREHVGSDRESVAVEGQIQNALSVDRVAHCLADQLVVKRSPRIVEIKRLHEVHRALLDIEVLLAQLRSLRAGQVGDQIQSAALKAHDQAFRALIDLIGHLVDVRGRSPVISEFLKLDRFLCRAGDELIRACADGRRVLFVIVSGNDGQRKKGHQFRVGLRERHHELVVAVLLKVRNAGQPFRGLGIDIGVVLAALEGIDDIVKVHGITVVELHAVTKGKSIDETVFRDLNLGCHRGDGIAVGIVFDKSLKDIEHNFLGTRRHCIVRVKALIEILRNADDDLIGFRSLCLCRSFSGLCRCVSFCGLCRCISFSGLCRCFRRRCGAAAL